LEAIGVAYYLTCGIMETHFGTMALESLIYTSSILAEDCECLSGPAVGKSLE
jgi:hypothetical protein